MWDSSLALTKSSLLTKIVSWLGRVHLPFTIFWRSRCEAQGQKRAPCSGVSFWPTRPTHTENHITEIVNSKRMAQSAIEFSSARPQAQSGDGEGYGAENYRDSHDEPPHKRQSTSDLDRRSTYEQQGIPYRPFQQARDPSIQPLGSTHFYSQGPPTAPVSTAPEYTYGHQRTNSAPTSSLFSPRNDFPGFQFSSPMNSLYPQSMRDQQYQFQQPQYADNQPRQPPSLAQPVPQHRPPAAMPFQFNPEQSRSLSRQFDFEPPTDRTYNSLDQAARVHQYMSQPPAMYDNRPLLPPARTLPDPTQPPNPMLPPLQALPSQHRRDDVQASLSQGSSSVEEQPETHYMPQSGQGGQGYPAHLYRDLPNG